MMKIIKKLIKLYKAYKFGICENEEQKILEQSENQQVNIENKLAYKYTPNNKETQNTFIQSKQLCKSRKEIKIDKN